MRGRNFKEILNILMFSMDFNLQSDLSSQEVTESILQATKEKRIFGCPGICGKIIAGNFRFNYFSEYNFIVPGTKVKGKVYINSDYTIVRFNVKMNLFLRILAISLLVSSMFFSFLSLYTNINIFGLSGSYKFSIALLVCYSILVVSFIGDSLSCKDYFIYLTKKRVRKN
jgi:hypothetical protein